MTTKKLSNRNPRIPKNKQSLRKPILVGGVYTNEKILKNFNTELKKNGDKIAVRNKYIFQDGSNFYEIYVPEGASISTVVNLGNIYYSNSPINTKLSVKLKLNQYTIYNLGNEQHIICFHNLVPGYDINNHQVFGGQSKKKYHILPDPTYNYKNAIDLINEEHAQSVYETPMKTNPRHSSPPRPIPPPRQPKTPIPPPRRIPPQPASNTMSFAMGAPMNTNPFQSSQQEPPIPPPRQMPPAVNRTKKPSGSRKRATPPKTPPIVNRANKPRTSGLNTRRRETPPPKPFPKSQI